MGVDSGPLYEPDLMYMEVLLGNPDSNNPD